jgi:hypothetical protein
MKNNNYVMLAVVAVVVGAITFFGGMKYQESKTPASTRIANGAGGNFAGANGQGGARMGTGRSGQNAGFRPVAGNILSIDDKTMTVKLRDGSSKIVLFSEKTVVNKTSEAAKTDLKQGDTVSVFGTTNTDGSVTAQNVQINPLNRMMNGGAAPSGGMMRNGNPAGGTQ